MSLYVKIRKNELQNIQEDIKKKFSILKDDPFISTELDELQMDQENIRDMVSNFRYQDFCEFMSFNIPPTLMNNVFLAIAYLLFDNKTMKSELRNDNHLKYICKDVRRFFIMFSAVNIDDIPEHHLIKFDEIIAKNNFNEEVFEHYSTATKQCFKVAMIYRHMINIKRKMLSDNLQFKIYNDLLKHENAFNKLFTFTENVCTKIT